MNDAERYYRELELERKIPRTESPDTVDQVAATIGPPLSPPAVEVV